MIIIHTVLVKPSSMIEKGDGAIIVQFIKARVEKPYLNRINHRHIFVGALLLCGTLCVSLKLPPPVYGAGNPG